MNDQDLVPKPVQSRRLTWGLCLLALAIMLAESWRRPLFMDEYSFLRNVAGFVQNRTLVPVYAMYPTFYSYLIAGPVYLAGLLLFFVRGFPGAGLHDPFLMRFLFAENVMVWTWLSRLVAMAAAAATLAMVLRRAAPRYRWAGVLVTSGALLMDPFGLFLARYGLPDAPMAFLVTGAMLLCVRYTEEGRRRHLYGAAFLAGLAASAKLNGAFALAPLLLTPALGPAAGRRDGRLYAAAAALAAAGFLAGSPALLLAPGVFGAGFAAEKGVLWGGHIGAHGPDWLWIPASLWRADPALTTLLALALVGCLLRRSREDILFLALLAPGLLVLGALPKKTLLYLAFAYPMAALMAGRLAHDLASRIRRPAAQSGLYVILILVFSLPFGRLYAAVRTGLKPDNTDVARAWIAGRVPHGAVILMDWAYLPRLRDLSVCEKLVADARADGSAFAGTIEQYYRQTDAYRLISLLRLDYGWAAVARADADYLITSDACYGRYLRPPGPGTPPPGDPLYERFLRNRAFYDALLSERTPYRLVKTFSSGQGPVVNVFVKSAAAGSTGNR